MNALDNNKNNKKEPTTTQTTVVKEIQKESPQENTTPNKDNTSTKENTTQEETSQSNKKEEKRRARKQQLRTLLHQLQIKKQVIMEHSQIRRVLKLKRISNHQNSFFPNLERSYFLLQYFSWFGSPAGPITPAISSSSIRRVARLNPTDKTTLNHRSTSFLRLDNQSLGFLKERIATSFTVREISLHFQGHLLGQSFHHSPYRLCALIKFTMRSTSSSEIKDPCRRTG